MIWKLVFIFSVWNFTLFSQEIDSSRMIRVMTYNIYHGETMEHDFNLDLLAGIIDSFKPDLVALQEVDYQTKRAEGLDLATELGWRLKMLPLFGEAMPYDGGSYGEGILSRLVFYRSQNHPLPFLEGHEPRAALEIELKLENQEIIKFIGTHLDHTENDEDRLRQTKEINRIFQNTGEAMILAGDMNAAPESEVIKELEKIWYDCANNKDFFTYPSDNPKERIDYIFVKPAEKWEVLEIHPVCDIKGSDHCGVFAVLYLKK